MTALVTSPNPVVRPYSLPSYNGLEVQRLIIKIRADKLADMQRVEQGLTDSVFLYKVAFPRLKSPLSNIVKDGCLINYFAGLPANLKYQVGYCTHSKRVELTSFHLDYILDQLLTSQQKLRGTNP